MSAPTELVDEFDLRSALAPLRPDPVAFAEGVRRRLREGKTAREETPAETTSPWLSVAASVIPLPLIGVKSVPVVPLSKLPLGAKLVGCAALPAAFFFAIGITIYAWLRIRHAQHSTKPSDIDPAAMQQELSGWWGARGFAYFILPVAPSFLMLWGYTLPLLLVFVASVGVVVWIVLSLGRSGALNRAVVAGSLGMPLVFAVQAVITVGERAGPHLLDQSYANLFMPLGVIVMTALSIGCSPKRNQPHAWAILAFLPVMILAALSMTQTLWKPIRVSDAIAFVESFDHAEHSSASWREWAIPAAWLVETGQPFDPAKPVRLLAASVEEQLGGYILAAACRGGIVDPEVARRLPQFEYNREKLLSEQRAGRAIIGPFDSGFLFAIVAINDLSDSQRDLLAGRLRASLARELESERAELDEILILHELLTGFGRPLDPDEWRERVNDLLVRFQVDESVGYARAGGFRLYESINSSDGVATLAAIRLMEIYGVPEEIDAIALRSWARPGLHAGMAQFVARQRLAALPDLPPLTWGDYLRCEQPLIFASLLTLLALVAVIGSPASQATGEDPS